MTTNTLYAICAIESGDGTVTGVAHFWQVPGRQTSIHISITGLSAGKHGLHIHEFGNLSDGCNTAGAHFNPMGLNHGAPDSQVRHVGDLGNISSNGPDQAAVLSTTDFLITLSGANSIIGRSVVVHALEDDLGRGMD